MTNRVGPTSPACATLTSVAVSDRPRGVRLGAVGECGRVAATLRVIAGEVLPSPPRDGLPPDERRRRGDSRPRGMPGPGHALIPLLGVFVLGCSDPPAAPEVVQPAETPPVFDYVPPQRPAAKRIASVSGRVLDGTSQRGVAGVRVLICDAWYRTAGGDPFRGELAEGALERAKALTDADGHFSVECTEVLYDPIAIAHIDGRLHASARFDELSAASIELRMFTYGALQGTIVDQRGIIDPEFTGRLLAIDWSAHATCEAVALPGPRRLTFSRRDRRPRLSDAMRGYAEAGAFRFDDGVPRGGSLWVCGVRAGRSEVIDFGRVDVPDVPPEAPKDVAISLPR